MSLQAIQLPDEGILLYEIKHKDGDVVKEHYHQVHQVLYALEGEGRIRLDGKDSVFNGDHVCVIAPGALHAIVSDSKLTVLVLAFDQAIFDDAVKTRLLDEHHSKLIKPFHYEISEVRPLLRKMLFEQSARHHLSGLAMKIILIEMLIVLSRSQQPHALTDANSLRAERIRHYIETHYFENLDADRIAGILGMSSRYINMIFKEHYNMTPVRYLTDLRIGLAKKLLTETDKDITSICFELGFETVSTFYRIFKDAAEIPPQKYRTLHKTREHHTVKDERQYTPEYVSTHTPGNAASSGQAPHLRAHPRSPG
ncbi:AraC family transcriptional regulator [Cohnella kolymensis]|uniref:AraC family transcriptional regulator n=1 Tax=Cohnella kolymensis TaxID=1590652 RepID=UPI0006967FCE|nr:AraC family transcriptional regulator [Cohnella kolymensis]